MNRCRRAAVPTPTEAGPDLLRDPETHRQSQVAVQRSTPTAGLGQARSGRRNRESVLVMDSYISTLFSCQRAAKSLSAFLPRSSPRVSA